MAEEDEWKKLSTDLKVQHKSWKARSEGYKECVKNFKIWDEGSPEFAKYLGLVKKFVTDSNELVRIQGLEAVLPFVENAQVAKKTCGEVVSGIILKCLNMKPRLKEAAIDVCLMYVEIDRNEQVQEEMIKGFSNKQPKVATACLETVTRALSSFGAKVIQVKPLLKEIPKLADHRDKLVREATKAMAIEIYRWAGPAIKTPLQGINALMLKELEEEWSKVEAAGKPVQTRFMRSQQDLREKMEARTAAAAAGGDSGAAATAVEQEPQLDPFDLLEPVEILSKLPKNFFEQIEAKKWQERREMLEACQKLAETPRIEPGDFGDLVRALKKVIAKDSNVMLVTIAAKCITGIAKGIRKKFQPFTTMCVDAILEKFKEKKPTVVAALQEAIDAVYMSSNLQGVSESSIEGLNNKNPSIREQTGLFLARALEKTKASTLNKATIKPIIQALLKNVDHSAPSVRDAAFQALGTLLGLVGDKIMMPFIADVDPLKIEKIKTYAQKTGVQGKMSAPAQQATSSAPPAKTAEPPAKKTSAKPASNKPKTVKGGQKPSKASKPAPVDSGPPLEAVLSDVAVEDLIAEFLSPEVIAQLGNMNWKERLEGLKSLSQKLKLSDVKTIPCQAIVKTLGTGKPGWKDNNFNCLNEKFAIVKNLAENAMFSKTTAELCLTALIEKVGDVKCGISAKEAITAIAEATGFPWISESVLQFSMAHKNPKIQSESLNWLSIAIQEFGMTGANVKLFIEKVKIGFAATNPGVRTGAFSVLSIMTLYIGPKIRMFFENEKPALLQQIDAEIEKKKGESPPPITRGIKSSSQNESEEEEDSPAPAAIQVEDLMPRVNIADKITEGLIAKMSDKNWKIRKEGLEEIAEIINEAKFVEPTIGDLASALKLRLADSNKILVTSTLARISQLSTALGTHCPKHVKVLAPGMIQILADSKPNVRQAGLNCMNQWLENTQLSVWFEDEIISTALSLPKYTFLRIELLNWMSEKLLSTPKLTNSAKEGLEDCVKHLYSCCEDRSGEVRAKAQAALPAFIYHLGMDKMVRLSGKLSPTFLSVITGLLEKAKENVPARKSTATKKSKQAQKINIEIDVPAPSVADATHPESSKAKDKSSTKPAAKAGKRPATSSKKAPEEEDTSPALVNVPNAKEQRVKDEQKLKTLKWIFDAPREELISQLKTQIQPCVSSAMSTELFHLDFQHHLKALTILTQSMESQWEATVGSLDLLLRWSTLRFYDKNTTVHMRCLEYLKQLFSKLDESNFRLTDYEASGFLPHLITKIGEPKENIRRDVHTIIQQITKVYPAGKVFNHLMQGLATKNSRQKTECLDELGILISIHGLEVCQPTPPKALREIATHIGDRDNGVRSAALNVLVCAYNSCGDMIYKFVGKLNEKNLSMLEERIKRSGKFSKETADSPAPKKPESRAQKPAAAKSTVERSKISTSDLHSSATVDGGTLNPPHTMEVDESLYQLPQLHDTSCDDLLNEEVPEVFPKFVSQIQSCQQRRSTEVVDSTLNLVITCLASSDIDICLNAIHQLDEVLNHPEKHKLLKPRIDQILITSCIQIRMATHRYLADVSPDGDNAIAEGDAGNTMSKVISLYKSLLSINMTIFRNADLALCASANSLQDFLHALFLFAVDKRLDNIPNGNRIISIFNLLVAALLVTANLTNVTCALLKLMRTTMEGTPSNIRELVIKSLWKIVTHIRTNAPASKAGQRSSIQAGPVLAEVHYYLTAYPHNHVLHKQREDKSYRTIKLVVHTLCNVAGPQIIDGLSEVENVESSELLMLLRKGLKNDHPETASRLAAMIPKTTAEKKENTVASMNGDMSPGRKLSLIVKKVGNRELTKQGLQELYDFRQQHPDYDIESGFTNMTPLFLNYIKRSLDKIEKDRHKGVSDASNVLKSTNKSPKGKDYFEHIRMLRARCGLPVDGHSRSENAIPSKSATSAQCSETVADSKQLHAPVSNSVGKETAEVEVPPAAVPQRPASASNIDSLKRRLEKIKESRLQV